MEFLSRNLFNTTTLATVTTNTSALVKLINRKSDSFALVMSTSTSFSINILINYDVDRIIIENCNWAGKTVQITYNGGTAISITAADTGTANWSSSFNHTDLFLKTVSTLSIATMTIAVGAIVNTTTTYSVDQLWICRQQYEFERDPASKDYKIKIDRKQFNHQLSDGGNIQYLLNDYFDATIKNDYITSTERDSLKTLYDTKDSFVFVPFPTGTAWNTDIYETNWIGDFDWIQRSSNDENVGYRGSMKLKETGK